MNRHEVEQRLRTVEAKLQFIMNTLSVSRKHNKTGKQDALTFEAIFDAGVKRGMDTSTTQDVAGHQPPGSPDPGTQETDQGAGDVPLEESPSPR